MHFLQTARETYGNFLFHAFLATAAMFSLQLTGCSNTMNDSASPSESQQFVQAAWDNDVPKLKQMISSGIDVNIRANKIVQPISEVDPVMVNGQMTLAVRVPQLPDWYKSGCNSAIEAASLRGNILIIRELVSAKATVNSDGCIPLWWTSLNGNVEATETLLAARANPNSTLGDITPLMAASISNVSSGDRTRIMLALINAGANINAVTKEGHTALIDAAKKGHADAVRILISAKADVNRRTNDGETALVAASKSGHKEIVSLLRKAGAH